MKKYKIKVMILVFIVIAIPGILKINYEYTKRRVKEPGAYVLISNDNKEIPVKSDMYNEIRLSRKNEKKLRINFSLKPFDLRFNIEDKVLYINKGAFSNIYEYGSKLISQGGTYFNQGLNNAKNASIRLLDSTKEKVLPSKGR